MGGACLQAYTFRMGAKTYWRHLNRILLRKFKPKIIVILINPSTQYLTIDPSMIFSTFYMDHLGNIPQHYRKERLKISQIAKFESETS